MYEASKSLRAKYFSTPDLSCMVRGCAEKGLDITNGGRVGRLTRMDAMQQQAMSKAEARLADLERQPIQSSLGRMQSGDYGYCIICDEEIAEGRLGFDPSVLTCISCAKEADGP